MKILIVSHSLSGPVHRLAQAGCEAVLRRVPETLPPLPASAAAGPPFR
jgi:hypothetical protein